MKLTTSNKPLTQAPKNFVRLVLVEGEATAKFVETKDGLTECRLGIGKRKKITPEVFATLVRKLVVAAKEQKIERMAIELNEADFPSLKDYRSGWFASTLAENLLLAAYEFTAYKTGKSTAKPLQEILLCNASSLNKKAWQRGKTVGAYTNKARDIANTPGDDMTPAALANEAKKLVKDTDVKVKVLDKAGIKKEGLHALWAVGKGAKDEPRFIVMEYFPLGKAIKDRKKQPLVLVGKGITYDTGGLNVKPSGHMHDMHMDMSGGSSVMAAIAAAAKLGIKKNIVAIIPAAENAVSDRAMRAGDIINSHSGKTIEVLHTDAEGRLVLADGLSYAARYQPRAVLDVATLTGAALVALGQHASVVMTEDRALQDHLLEIGQVKDSGDRLWPLPLWDEYKQPLTKSRADVANIYPSFSRFAGAIEGAAFLSFFAPKCPWAHIDIAPRIDSIPTDKLAKGSTGEPVRLLVRFLESY